MNLSLRFWQHLDHKVNTNKSEATSITMLNRLLVLNERCFRIQIPQFLISTNFKCWVYTLLMWISQQSFYIITPLSSISHKVLFVNSVRLCIYLFFFCPLCINITVSHFDQILYIKYRCEVPCVGERWKYFSQTGITHFPLPASHFIT